MSHAFENERPRSGATFEEVESPERQRVKARALVVPEDLLESLVIFTHVHNIAIRIERENIRRRCVTRSPIHPIQLRKIFFRERKIRRLIPSRRIRGREKNREFFYV